MDPKMGLINTIIDKIRIIIPNPIWAILTHDGDFSTAIQFFTFLVVPK
jgi:hypothetical protein